MAQFGSGYVWLYGGFDGRLAVRATHDAMNPLLDGVMPLAPSLDCPGPMVGSIEDLRLAWEVLAGPDSEAGGR